jgi:hypothetical protein
MGSETYIYSIKLQGDSLEQFRSGKLSIIDEISNALDIPQKNIAMLKKVI